VARALTAVRCLNFPRYGHAAHRTTANFYLTLLAAASLAALIPIAVVQKTVLMENLLDLFKAPQVIAQFGQEDLSAWPFWKASDGYLAPPRGIALLGLAQRKIHVSCDRIIPRRWPFVSDGSGGGGAWPGCGGANAGPGTSAGAAGAGAGVGSRLHPATRTSTQRPTGSSRLWNRCFIGAGRKAIDDVID